ncbi:phosphate-starvation-inducible PsiE family protein [Vagococcus hydrophili]|uniref:Protein PsiE n=1 Tax=Vagococcus hydrophili TaxID=2714947 RepID=A0A6G8AVU5_9ENTE|nr:phosphate-starvation-inducible PsiE family protein [Vagococcus hydrophili]QIL49184.1 phosphate-starvation-inducible protein PsiE [Vagococcus hydrophili]
MFKTYEKVLYSIVNIFLFILALLIIAYMARDLIGAFNLIMAPNDQRTLEDISGYILSFFMLFEFIVMIVKYIEDAHDIPIKYLVIISITAILRQLLVVHNDGLQTLLLTISTLILAGVLYLLELSKKKRNEDKK